ncbi:MAG TPA: hypothetical protein VJ717_13225, partial [Gemmatimonadaceae bacterium]|nr:hypothetical protein [Gemmatimonadaceae bacterium]
MTPIDTIQRSRTFPLSVGACALSLLGLLAPTTSAAQLIVVKTMPIADSDQFSFFPSLTFGMGGTRIAIADSVHDPFVNPALGARIRQSHFFSAPTFFSVSGKAGSGSTVPIGALGKTGSS